VRLHNVDVSFFIWGVPGLKLGVADVSFRIDAEVSQTSFPLIEAIRLLMRAEVSLSDI